MRPQAFDTEMDHHSEWKGGNPQNKKLNYPKVISKPHDWPGTQRAQNMKAAVGDLAASVTESP